MRCVVIAGLGLECPFFFDFGLVAFVSIAIDPAAFMSNHGAYAIDLDATALTDETIHVNCETHPLRDTLGNQSIVGVTLLVAPAIESEVGNGKWLCSR